MVAMEIRAEIKWIQSELDKVDDPALIEIFIRLPKYRNTIQEVFLDEYINDLDEAIARIESGKYISQEELKKEIKVLF